VFLPLGLGFWVTGFELYPPERNLRGEFAHWGGGEGREEIP